MVGVKEYVWNWHSKFANVHKLPRTRGRHEKPEFSKTCPHVQDKEKGMSNLNSWVSHVLGTGARREIEFVGYNPAGAHEKIEVGVPSCPGRST